MKLETFFENFQLLTDAPNAVAKLRNLILQLAFKGKLITQKSNDDTAFSLLKKIQLHRIQAGKAEKVVSEISFNKKGDLLTIPESWIWCRVEQIATVCLGGTPARNEALYWNGNIPWVSSGEVANCRITKTKELISSLGLEKSNAKIYPKGTVLIAMIGQGKTRGQAAILDIEACTNQNVAGLVFDAGNIEPNYVWKWALTEYERTRSGSRGGAQPALNGQKIRALWIPLPPLAEQKRIVEKCDRLLSICDEIEKRQQRRQESILRMNESAIAQLLSSQNPDEFRQHWQRICNNFDLLYSVPETIPKLRQAILQLAVQGKLVPQYPIDEPASTLLKNIQYEKEQLIKSKQIKQDKALPKIEQDIVPFVIPKGWQWCYVSDISTKITDGEHLTPQRASSGYYLLSARNVRDEGIALDDVDYVPEDEFLRIRKRCDPNKGDILISCSGSVGRVAIVDRDETYVMVRSAALVKPFKDYVMSEFLAYTLRSLFVQNQIIEKSRTSAQANLFLGKIKEIKIVLPPLTEQKRIVEKCDRLMSLCDTLEAKLKQGRDSSEKLMEIAARQVLVV